MILKRHKLNLNTKNQKKKGVLGMKKKFKKSMVMLLTMAMILSTFSLGAYANPEVQEIVTLQLAKLYGEYDLSSSISTTVIVELEEPSIVQAKHMGKSQNKENLASERGKVINAISNQISNVKVNREYDYLISGFALELPQNELLQLLTIPGIKAVYPNVHYTNNRVGNAIIIDKEAYSPMMNDSAPFIEANKAWEAGYTGKGITVAILDTGVDHTHPDLKNAFGEYKGWDFVDNDNDPQETSVGDPDLDTDHGTHVAGTVAANGYIKGVAPEARLLAYRVLGPGGRGSTANILAGIELAVQDGADVMNLSLGADVNNPDYATSLALDWAMAEGVVAVTSNGNSGPTNWTVGSPGTSRRAISVGATQLPYNVYTSSIFTSEEVQYTSPEVMGFPSDDEIMSLNGESFEFVNVGLGRAADFMGLDLTGKVALISRGGIPFVEKSDNAKTAGAIATIIYNNNDGQIEHYVSGISLPTIKLSKADGEKMLSELEKENNLVKFSIDFSHRIGETMADFSSRGPVMNTWMIKPDVSAPGVGIVSTIPTHNPNDPHGYAAFQGTSMSSPHVAGAAALILQANPSWSVDFVKAALMNTAANIYDENVNLYPHNSQGAGSIRILDAINTKILVTPGSHSFGVFNKDNGKEVRRQSFTIHNLSNERIRYNVEFIGHQGIKVQTSNNLQVQPGKTQELNFGVQVDSNLQPGYYEGTFLLNDGKNTVEVPTILFVGEPDYPRTLLEGRIFANNGDGTYTVGSHIPYGADLLEYDLYLFAGGVGPILGTFGIFENEPGPTHQFIWNASGLPAGQYAMFIYVEKDGRYEYKGWLITIN